MDINDELTCAVQQGDLDKLRELIGTSNLRTPSEAERGYVLLCKAIECSHKEIIKFFLQSGALVNAPGNTECVKLDSPLIIAIRKEDVSLVQTLLDLGASVYETIHFRLTIAIDVGNAEIVKLLVKNNADVKFKCEGGGTILDLVAGSKKMFLDTDIVELLIDKGATLLPYPECIHGAHQTGRKKNEGLTQLHLAANRGYLSVVERLLKRGASANSTCTFNGREGYTPLHIACNRKDGRTAECLLRYGADVNAYAEGDLTPLHVAVGKKCTDLVELLLIRGANVDASDQDGKTVLHLAVEMLHLPMVDCILRSLPNLENEDIRKSVCSSLSTDDYAYIINNSIRIFMSLSRGSQLAEGREGFTLLHSACKDCNVNDVRRFLDKGAEIDARAKNGNTPLHEAVLRERKDIVELLLDAGANIDHQNEYGYSALSLAVEKGNTGMVKFILKHGPDINNKANKKSIRNVLVNKITFEGVYRYRKIVNCLYRYGFSMDSDILHDSAFLKEAIKKGYLNIVEDFLKYSTKDELLSFTCGDSVMFVAWQMQKVVVRLLISYESDLNISDSPAQTPIFYAMVGDLRTGTYLGARYRVRKNDVGYSETDEIFLRHGADSETINITFNEEGQTDNKVEEAKVLIRQAANVTESCSRSMTPFYIAFERTPLQFQILFLERMVPDFKNKAYRELLRSASFMRMPWVNILFQVPLKSGADINSVDENGETLIYFARQKWDAHLVLRLLKHGCDISQIMVKYARHPKLFDLVIGYILKRHMVKLIVAGLERSDVALYRFKGDKDFITRCSMELETVEKENVPDTSVSFRDILTNDTHRLATYAKNETLVEFLESDKCKAKFGLYSSVMKGLIWRGIVRKCLLERSIIVFRSYGGFFCELPDICVDHILSHLNDEDLRIFTRFNKDPSGI